MREADKGPIDGLREEVRMASGRFPELSGWAVVVGGAGVLLLAQGLTLPRNPLFKAKIAAYAVGVVFAWLRRPIPMAGALAFATWAAWND